MNISYLSYTWYQYSIKCRTDNGWTRRTRRHHHHTIINELWKCESVEAINSIIVAKQALPKLPKSFQHHDVTGIAYQGIVLLLACLACTLNTYCTGCKGITPNLYVKHPMSTPSFGGKNLKFGTRVPRQPVCYRLYPIFRQKTYVCIYLVTFFFVSSGIFGSLG